MKRIIALLMSCILLLCIFAGCSQKEEPKTAEELVSGALDVYTNAMADTKVSKLIKSAYEQGLVTIRTQNGDESQIIRYFAADNALTFALGNHEIPYGIKFSDLTHKLVTSALGTQGGNLLGLDTESEKQLLTMIEKLTTAPETPDMQAVMKTLSEYADMTVTYDATATIRNETVKVNAVTLNITKSKLSGLLKHAVRKIDEQVTNSINDLISSLTNGEYKSLNDVIDSAINEAFKKYSSSAPVITIKLLLDTEYDALLKATISAMDAKLEITLGADPKNINCIDFQMTANGETETAQLTIEKTSTSITYTFAGQGIGSLKNGYVFEIDKAHGKINLYELYNSERTLEVSIDYKLTADTLSLSFMEDEQGLEISFSAKQTNIGEYKDILSMTEDEITELLDKIGYNSDSNDDWYGNFADDDLVVEMEKYLSDKYQLEFSYDYFETDVNSGEYLFNANGLDAPVTVMLTAEYYDALSMLGEVNDGDFYPFFTEKFVDNGYGILIAEEVNKYFDNIAQSNFGTYRFISLLTTSNLTMYPSHLNANVDWQDAVSQYPDYFESLWFVFTDEHVSQEDVDDFAATLEPLGMRISLYVAYCEAEHQYDDGILDDIINEWLSGSDNVLTAEING